MRPAYSTRRISTSFPSRAPCVAQHDGCAAVEIQRAGDVLGLVTARAGEAVHGDHERDAPVLEVVHRREAVLQPPGVREDDGAEGALGQFVPQEPETVLARGAEQVEGQAGADGDAPEVHGDGRGDLLVDAAGVVHQLTGLAEQFLRAQRPDLADRADQGRLAHAEPAGDQDLQGQLGGVAAGCFGVLGGHRSLLSGGPDASLRRTGRGRRRWGGRSGRVGGGSARARGVRRSPRGGCVRRGAGRAVRGG